MTDTVLSDQTIETSSLRQGSNQRGMRNYNERLILETIREHGDISKADLAKLTKLSPQTATIIVNRLINDGLLRKLKSVKGKVGQPRTPITLDPNGAFSFGIKVGRRSVEIFLLDFTYAIIERRTLRYAYPQPQPVLGWVCDSIHAICDALPKSQQSRVLGIGLAQPFGLENWQEMIGAPNGAMEQWRGFDLRAEIETRTGFDTQSLNDASAACLAELLHQPHRRDGSFLYIYLGTIVGGGLVSTGKLFEGMSGNAGALASLPLTRSSGQDTPVQLIELASFNTLDLWATAHGYNADIFQQNPLPIELDQRFAAWCKEAADGLAMAIISAQAFMDMEYVVLDGSPPNHLIGVIKDATQKALVQYDIRGINRPELRLGQLGNEARALGAGLLTFRKNFAADETAFAIT